MTALLKTVQIYTVIKIKGAVGIWETLSLEVWYFPGRGVVLFSFVALGSAVGTVAGQPLHGIRVSIKTLLSDAAKSGGWQLAVLGAWQLIRSTSDDLTLS